MKEKKLMDYVIQGKVELKDIEKKSTESTEEVPLMAYAIRDRRVLNSAPVAEDGSFEITYNYKSFGKEQTPYGVDIIIGPELPNDEILQTKLERTFLSSKGFRPIGSQLVNTVIEPIHIPTLYPLRKCSFTYTGFVYTCSPLRTPPGGQEGCRNPEVLSCAGSEVEAFVRLKQGKRIIAEGIEVEPTGKFEKIHKWLSRYYCFSFRRAIEVEVYQETDTGEHSLYKGEHYFTDKIAEDIFIDRDKTQIICVPPTPTPEVSNFFGFERVGNIPVEAIYKESEVTGEFGTSTPVPEAFVGYVNSVDKPHVSLGSADLELKDFAFYSTLHFYGNIGESFGMEYEDGVDMSEVSIKYFRIKYNYLNPQTNETIDNEYLSVPFNNTRKSSTGTVAENMKVSHHPVSNEPLTIPTYIYPNPYETDVEKNWKYRGLMFVLNTNTLPRLYGKYTFTLEPLDLNMNPITAIEDPNDCQLTLLIDNDEKALSAEIESLLKADGSSTNPCGVIDLTSDGNPADIRVKYNIHHEHKNLRDYRLKAYYGKGKYVEFEPADNVYVRSDHTPYWESVNSESSKNHAWEKCAYQFRLSIRRRVTNGFSTKYWEGFTYHVSIDSSNPYTS